MPGSLTITANFWAIRALLFICGLMFAFVALRGMFSLADLTLPEGAVVYSVKGLLTGAWPLYRDYTLPPYSTTPYTPLFYLVSALLALATTKSVYAIYICCRLLSLGATLCAAFFVRKISLLLEGGPMRFPAFLLPFTILILIAWGYSARPDMMAVMLSLAGMYVYLQNPQRLASFYMSAILLALAWWCKQSFVAAPAAILLALTYAREWRRTCVFLFAYLTPLLLLAGLTQYLSHGQFYANIVTANVTKLQPDQVYWLTVDAYVYLASSVTAFAFIACTLYFRDAFHSRARYILAYLLISVLLNMAACLKEGAYLNYMLEPLFVASILAAFAAERMLKSRYYFAVLPLLIVSLAFSYGSNLHGDEALVNALTFDVQGQNARIQSILNKVNALKGDVLILNSALAARSDKPVLAIDMFNTRYLEEAGKLSTTLLAGRIRQGELTAVIAPEGV